MGAGRHDALRGWLLQGFQHGKSETAFETGDAELAALAGPHAGHEKNLSAAVLDNAIALAGEGANPGGEAFIEGGHGVSGTWRGAIIALRAHSDIGASLFALP